MKMLKNFRNYVLLSLLEVILVVFVYGLIFHEHFWTVWQKEGVAWILLAVLLVALGNNLIFEHQKKKRLASEMLILEKLTEMVANNPGRHVLLAKNDEFYAISRQVNRLQTKQRSLMRKYEQQNRDYLSLLQSLTSGVIVFDQHKQVVLYNHVAQGILQLGSNAKEQHFYQVFTAAELILATQKVYQTKKDQRFLWQTKDAWYEVQFVYVPLSRHHYSVMCIFNDITEIKQIEVMQREFMANAGHELKTPLTAIQGFSETLLAGALDDKETAYRFVKIISEQSAHLKELIDDISALAKNSGPQELRLEKIALRSFCGQLIAGYTQKIKEKNLTLQLEIPKDFTVRCDKRHLQHIIGNLLQNAIRYNINGGKITLKVNKKLNEWQLFVYNTGQTIKEAKQKRIFERFYRADQSRSNEGSGLGLAIVKESVLALSGRITVESPYQEGTRFILTLPCFLN
ncbi:sensor histidine kinase [Ligilactobacillus apodemi]|uniref:sensor histidine kinase n=1 Tax=Ligilactobacillus apodemi TaxID=307126 RepID=UPI00046819A5|nr:PAS domain-containing sensor histidine kinase [Ligilactobacillus apodemi]